MKRMCAQLRTPANASRLFSRPSGQRGAELFEFALVLPVLLMLLLGIIWMGRAYNVYQTITRAAREGARYAVLPNCATCGNVYVDTYSTLDSCLSGTTNVFTNYVSPVLQASNLDPVNIPSSGTGAYCQQAIWLGTTDPKQCGVAISFIYPVQVTIPFTSINATTLNIRTRVQMRMENQSVDSAGAPTCP
jgi:Flp pilus assembly protein TadG